MRILTRYVVFELVKVFLLTLTGFTLVIYIALIGKEAVDKGIGLGPLLQMCPYLLPQAMQFAVPGTILLATTSVYGRMASYNEILAVKSLGISPMVLIWPTIVLAIVLSFAETLLNDVAMSWGRLGVERVFLASIEEVTYGHLRMRHSHNFGKLSITVRDVIGHRLIEPTIIMQASAGRPPITVSAREAEIHLVAAENKLVVSFVDLDMSGGVKYIDPDKQTYEIPIEELTGSNEKTRSPSTYALAEIKPAIAQQEQLVAGIKQGIQAQTAFAMLTGDFDALSESAWQARERELTAAQSRLYRLHTEPWRRWANGFSCLCFVLIGCPVAMWLRFSEMLASFFVCFLPILVVYYPLIAVSVDKAKDGVLPPASVWLGNILLALVGVWLMRRVNRN
jgi:lipopolysaccharide export system permease protein